MEQIFVKKMRRNEKTNESVPYLRRITVQRRNHKRIHEFGSNERVNERTNERKFE